MSHRIGVVSDEGVALGFRLAGVRPRVVDSRDGAARVLDGMIRDGTWGVILVQEDLVPPGLAPSWRRSTAGLPIVVPFPAPRRERPVGDAEAYVAELLRQAVGYRVRLR